MDQAGDEEESKSSLEKIKKQLNCASGSVILQGPLLKRSETLRKWNQRWFTLDPSIGKMEYRAQQFDLSPRGSITFDADSTVTLTPTNFQRDKKYDGCGFYVGSPQKKEYFLCAGTPVAAKAWVATLRAAVLVLRAHREAVNSLSGNGHAKVGTVAAIVAAANATAQEAAKDLQMSMRATSLVFSASGPRGGMDNVAVMKETLRVKDEELNQLAGDLKARNFTIQELTNRLSETASAADSAASAVHAMDRDHKVALSEMENLRDELLRFVQDIRAADERAAAALKARELALQEAHMWRLELGKLRERSVVLEGAVLRAEENARQLKLAFDHELADCSQRAAPRAVETNTADAHDERKPALSDKELVEDVCPTNCSAQSTADAHDERKPALSGNADEELVEDGCPTNCSAQSTTVTPGVGEQDKTQSSEHPTDSESAHLQEAAANEGAGMCRARAGNSAEEVRPIPSTLQHESAASEDENQEREAPCNLCCF